MKKTVKRNILITAVLAIAVVIAGLLLLNGRTNGSRLSEDEARRLAEGFLPQTAVFVSGSEIGNEYELHYFDTAAGHSYRIKVNREDQDVNSIYAHAVSAEEGSRVDIERSEIISILESQFDGAEIEEMGFIDGQNPPAGTIHISFSWQNFSGTMDLNPETGDIISFSLKTAAQVVIPVDGSDSRRFLSDVEARERAQELLEAATIHDVELDMIGDVFVYEIYASDSSYNYVININAETGEQINRKTTRTDWSQLPDQTDSTDKGEGSGSTAPTSTGSETTSTTPSEPANETTPTPTTAPTTATPTTAPTTNPPTQVPTTAAPTTAAPTTAPTPPATNTVGTRDWAIQLALARVPGATAAHVVDADYDDDDYEWEVEIIYNSYQYEIKINARNGQVIDIEIDEVDD